MNIVIVPFHKSILNDLERISLNFLIKNYNGKIEILFPRNIEIPKEFLYLAEIKTIKIRILNQNIFKNLFSYNRFKISIPLYIYYIRYRWLITYELDSVLLKSGVDDFLETKCFNISYIGGPWFMSNFEKTVGNSGFSARRITHCLKVLLIVNFFGLFYRILYKLPNRFGFSRWYIHSFISKILQIKNSESLAYLFLVPISNEYIADDIFWSRKIGKTFTKFRLATFEIALEFSWDEDKNQCLLHNKGTLPFGFHKFEINLLNQYNITYVN